MSRRILSLCDYCGTWSQPYVDAGYDVLRIDLQRDGRLLDRREWNEVPEVTPDDRLAYLAPCCKEDDDDI